MRPGLLILRYLNSHQDIKNLLKKQEMPNDVCSVSVELRGSWTRNQLQMSFLGFVSFPAMDGRKNTR